VVAALGTFLTQMIANHGYAALFVLMALSSACVPIPSEVVMAFGGALASATFAAGVLGSSTSRLDLAAVIALGVAGTLTGSWLAWAVGFLGGRPLVERFGRYLLLRPHEIDRAHAWFERHGEATVCFARLIPLVRAFISLPAGVARMPFWRFTVYTVLGTLPWTVGLALAGYGLGERWNTVERLGTPISVAVGLVALAALAWWIRSRLRARRSGELAATGGGDG